MFYACVWRFDVTGTVQNFLETKQGNMIYSKRWRFSHIQNMEVKPINHETYDSQENSNRKSTIFLQGRHKLLKKDGHHLYWIYIIIYNIKVETIENIFDQD